MKRRVALFDFDGTLVRGDSIAAFVRKMCLRGVMSWPLMVKVLWRTLLWRLGLVAVEAVKSLSLSPLKQLSDSERDQFCRAFALQDLLPRLYRDGLEAMKRHAKAGDLVLLVSASPAVYLSYLQEALPVDGILATRTDTAFQVTRNMVREEKCLAIRQWLDDRGIDVDWAQSTAYGDSANDLPMLSMVGQPRLVNPGARTRRRGAGIPALSWK